MKADGQVRLRAQRYGETSPKQSEGGHKACPYIFKKDCDPGRGNMPRDHQAPDHCPYISKNMAILV